MKKTLLILGTVLALIVVPAALYFSGVLSLGGEAHAEAPAHTAPAAPRYLALDPPFIVNFLHRGSLRYLQVSLEVSYPHQEQLDKVEAVMPAIRNELIMLFSGQEFESLNSLAGKEQLRRDIRQAIDRLIADGGEEAATSGGEIYITSFVMQ